MNIQEGIREIKYKLMELINAVMEIEEELKYETLKDHDAKN